MSRVTERLRRTAARVADRINGEEFIIGGISYIGNIKRAQVSVVMQAAGEIAVDEYTISAHIDQFAARPVRGALVLWNGKTWTVKQDVEPENPTHVILTIMREGKHR